VNSLPESTARNRTYRLPSLPYLRLRMTLLAKAPARLPAYKGSLLRGAFGHALRRSVCAMGPEQPCDTCSLRTACIHTRLFECLIEGEPPPLLRGLPTAPRPYVFEPGDDRKDFAVGDELKFDLLLIGQAVELQAYAVLAVERMAATGLGANRHPFELQTVDWQDAAGNWQKGFEKGVRNWPGGAPPTVLKGAAESQAPSRVELHFLTPTRIKIDDRLVERVSFRMLAFKILRRALELTHFHVPSESVDWHFRPYLELAERVNVVEEHLRWLDWDRYSNRQHSKMTFGGFVGHLVLEGELAPFLPLLKMAEVVHVGKGATFGLGRVKVG
jgi:CRISPR-associated endoribonuclease Cas6